MKHFFLIRMVLLATVLLSACVPAGTPDSLEAVTEAVQPARTAPRATTQPAPELDPQATPALELESPQAPGLVRFPAFDPAGMVAVSGNGLELIDPDTHASTQIFAGAEDDPRFDPLGMFLGGFVWSPDGNKLAFQYRRQNGQGYLLVADFETGEIRPLVSDFSVYSMVGWSPDGQQVAFVEQETDSTGRLMVLSLADGRRQQLTDQAYWIWNGLPAWLDDDQIAYLHVAEEETGQIVSLVRQGLDEPAPQVVIAGDRHSSVQRFAVSPDRASLLYGSTSGFYYVEDWASGGGEPVFLGLSGIADSISWSPDGRMALLERGEGDKRLLRLDDKANPEILELEVLGVAPFPQPWSGNSQRLILFDTESAGDDLITYHIATGASDWIPIEVLYSFAAAWNPK